MSTTKFCNLLLLLVGICILTDIPFFHCYAGNQQTTNPSILILSAYSVDHLATEYFLNAELKVIRADFPNAEVYTEFFDWKRFPLTENFENMHRFLAEKYQNVHLDLILTNDNVALDFAMKHRGQFLSDAPIVFAGVNGFDSIAPTIPARVTGVAETIDPAATLHTALALQPRTKRIVIITDKTESGMRTRNEIERIIMELKRHDIEFTFADSLPLQEILTLVGSLGTDAFVFYTYFNRDATGTLYSSIESVERIAAASTVPVYHAFKTGLGRGIVGGHLFDPAVHGATAGQMVVKILKGTPVDSVAILRVNPCPPMFDAKVMKRLGISLRRLPPGSHIINVPDHFVYRYRWLIFGIVAFVVLQSIAIFLLLINIAQRKKAETKLIQSETRFRNLIEGSPVPVIIARRGIITYANKAFLDLRSATSFDELIGVSVLDLVAEPYKKMVQEFIQLRESGVEIKKSYEIMGVGIDGKQVPLRLFAASVRMENGLSTIVYVTDLTDQKKAEEERLALATQVLQAQKMESLGVLAGGIAHDFNNLLMGISAHASMARSFLPVQNEASHYLETLQKAVTMASQLSRRLLTFSSGGAPMKTVLAVTEIIRNSAEFALHGSQHTLQLHLNEDLWPIEADVGQINQVISNLIINAAQAMSHTGVIEISARNDEVFPGGDSAEATGKYVVIEVTDSGIGISPKIIDRIFEPFFTTKEKGSGLGLSSVYSIVTAHGGGVTVRSVEGEGSTFSVRLPAYTGEVPVKNQLRTIHNSRALKILVMDDDAIVRSGVVAMLKSLGHVVTEASDGKQAVELYRNAEMTDGCFDMVIMDLTVPGGMGGSDTLRILREHNNTIRAIAMSGYVTNDVMTELSDSGFSVILAKPFTLDEIGSAIARTIVA